MSLQVWLPLNGDLHNQGLGNIQFINNGATVNLNGKIGKCYNFNGTHIYSDKYCNEIFQNNNNFSICCWLQPISRPSTNGNGIISCNRYYTETTGTYTGGGVGLTIKTDGRIACFINNNIKEQQIILNSLILELNKWYHICTTYSNGTIIFYINGQKVQETNNIEPWTINQNKILIGVGTQGGWNYQCENNINDVRIYDNALSAKEVEEISKGLILHYKLNKLGTNNFNLIKSLTAGGQTTVSGLNVTTSGTSADTYFYLNLESALSSSKSYTISCVGENFPEGTQFIFPIGAQANTGYAFTIKQGYNEYTFTPNDTIVNAGTKIILDDTNRTAAANQCKFLNLCLYENNQIDDSSGYNNNGIINSSSIAITSTTGGRYNKSFNNLSTVYPIKGNCYMPPSNTLTFSWWMNPTAWGMQASGIFSTSAGDATDYYTTAANMRDACFDCCNEAGTCVRINVSNYIVLNQWHHYSLVYNGSQLIFYKDGIQQITANQTGNLKSFNYIYPFYSKAGGTNRVCTGMINDFRIYATALSEVQIKELYNTSATVDNNGNFYSREVIE